MLTIVREYEIFQSNHVIKPILLHGMIVFYSRFLDRSCVYVNKVGITVDFDHEMIDERKKYGPSIV